MGGGSEALLVFVLEKRVKDKGRREWQIWPLRFVNLRKRRKGKRWLKVEEREEERKGTRTRITIRI